MTKDEIVTKVKSLNLPKDSYVVFGSGPLAAAGIRETNDIDMLVSPEVFEQLKKKGWKELVKGPDDKPLVHGDFEVHSHWNFSPYAPTLNQLLETATEIDGVMFASLDEVRKWKKATGGEKHLADVVLIYKFVSRPKYIITKQREELLATLAEQINSVKSQKPICVAIDGIDNAGKTTLADELIKPLKSLGLSVQRASFDNFYVVPEIRYKRGRYSPEGYYYDSFNGNRVVKKLLKHKKEAENSVLLYDGVFALRPELLPYWDVKIFLRIDFKEMLKRAKIRDRGRMGEDLEQRYEKRYIPAQKLYFNLVNPEKLADIIIDNSDFGSPFIVHR